MSTLLSVTCGAIPFHSAPFELCARAGSSAAIRSRTLVAPASGVSHRPCTTTARAPASIPTTCCVRTVTASDMPVVLGINHRQTERQIWMGYSAGAPRVT